MAVQMTSERPDANIDSNRVEDAPSSRLAEDGRIVVAHLTKVLSTAKAVDDLSFTVDPGP